MFGGGGGGYTSDTASSPWKPQAQYLKPLFETAFTGASGKKLNPLYRTQR